MLVSVVGICLVVGELGAGSLCVPTWGTIDCCCVLLSWALLLLEIG